MLEHAENQTRLAQCFDKNESDENHDADGWQVGACFYQMHHDSSRIPKTCRLIGDSKIV